MEHFDVAIIGLGPAGSALARKLAGKMQVIALDKKHQCGTEGFSKPCPFFMFFLSFLATCKTDGNSHQLS